MNDEELFFAWLDGELERDEAARVAAQVASDPALKAKADRHRNFGSRLRGAFDPVVAEAGAPPRFSSPDVIDFQARHSQHTARKARPMSVATQWGAMAATLAIGIAVGSMLQSAPDEPVARENGVLVASASLENALYTGLASAPAAEGARIGLTFRDKSGAVCRSFTDRKVSGLACRDGGDWQIRGLFQGEEGYAGDYRMASGEDPRLAALVDERIAGEPFDAAAEKAAMEQGWR